MQDQILLSARREEHLPLTLASWTSWADGAAALAQAAAIVVGGIWAYFKFVRGRTFAKRAELSVTPTLLAEEKPKLKVKATLRNVGLSKLPLRTQAVFLYGIYAAGTAENPIATAEQQLGKPKRIFAAHQWIEAQETVTDELLLLLPDSQSASEHEWLAFRVECRVYAKQRRKGALSWTASALAPAEVGDGDDTSNLRAGVSDP
jgi:hypothetical protein